MEDAARMQKRGRKETKVKKLREHKDEEKIEEQGVGGI